MSGSLAGKTVVVTGAAGFIGGPVVRAAVASGARCVIAVDTRPLPEHLTSAIDRSVVTYAGRDILEPLDDLLAGTDVVVHLAAHVSPPRSIQDPLGDAKTNITGTLALLESIRRVGVPRLVYASSAAVYGTPEYLPVDEAHPTQPDSPYGLSKLTGERYCLLYGRLHGLSAVALRFFNVYGPHQPLAGGYAGVIRLFLDRYSRGQPLVVEGDGSQTRDFVHVEDVARAVVLAAGSNRGGAINVGSGVATSIEELAHTIAGPDYPVEHVAPRLGDIPHSRAAVDLARRELGFTAETSLEVGLTNLREQAEESRL